MDRGGVIDRPIPILLGELLPLAAKMEASLEARWLLMEGGGVIALPMPRIGTLDLSDTLPARWLIDRCCDD